MRDAVLFPYSKIVNSIYSYMYIQLIFGAYLKRSFKLKVLPSIKNTIILFWMFLQNFAWALFPISHRIILKENKNNAYTIFWGKNKEYYGIFDIGK